jgi:hypothetical protein
MEGKCGKGVERVMKPRYVTSDDTVHWQMWGLATSN